MLNKAMKHPDFSPERLAFHEAGHALQAIKSHGLYFTEAWINLKTGNGKSCYVINRDNFSLEEELQNACAGIAADRIFFGNNDYKMGTFNDTIAASNMATWLVKDKGIPGYVPPKLSIQGAWRLVRGYSDDEKNLIHKEAQALQERATEEVRVGFLSNGITTLENLAASLLEQKKLSRNTALQIVQRSEATPKAY